VGLQHSKGSSSSIVVTECDPALRPVAAARIDNPTPAGMAHLWHDTEFDDGAEQALAKRQARGRKLPLRTDLELSASRTVAWCGSTCVTPTPKIWPRWPRS